MIDYKRFYQMCKFDEHFLFNFILLLLFNSVFTVNTRAEGTRELAPSSTDRVYLLTNSANYYNFATYDGVDEQRMYIHILDPEAEQVFLGFSRAVNSGHFPCSGSTIDAFFRIKDPQGNVVFPVRGRAEGLPLNAFTSNITDKSQAMAGPVQIVGIGGYNAFVFDPSGLPAGNYYVEFSENIDTPSSNILAIEWWDITVATKDTNPAPINGRVFSKNWTLMTPSISCGTDPLYEWYDRPFNGKVYIYSTARMVARLDFKDSGFQAAAFNMFFNNSGAQVTGNLFEDRKSIVGRGADIAVYDIFLNDPDIVAFPSGVLTELETTADYYVCHDDAGCVASVISEGGFLEAIIDFDQSTGKHIFDPGTADIYFSYLLTPSNNESPPYERCIPWDGTNNLGQKVASGDSVDVFVRYSHGSYNFPIYDVEFFLNGLDPELIRPRPAVVNEGLLYYDDSNIPVPSGSLDSVYNSAMNGCNTPCHNWTNREFGDNNTINTWFNFRQESTFRLHIYGCPISLENDTSSTPINIPIEINLLDNDSSKDVIATNSVALGTPAPANGSVVFDPNTGNGIYTPNFAFIGQDSFEYTACFEVNVGDILCDTALVIIEVTPINENCFNNIDDDNDGFVDCDDPDCHATRPTVIIRKRNGKL